MRWVLLGFLDAHLLGQVRGELLIKFSDYLLMPGGGCLLELGHHRLGLLLAQAILSDERLSKRLHVLCILGAHGFGVHLHGLF